MSRNVLVLTVEEDGVKYGRVVKASELMDMQDFAHEHTEFVTRDLLMKNAPAAMVAGFGYALAGGLNLSIAEGHAVDAQGLSYQTLPPGQPSAVAAFQAHAALPRIDLVYASLVANQDGEVTAMPRRRVRTAAEELAGANPYPQQNTNVATRRNNVAVVGVRQGVAAANPAAPALGAGEVPLYHVRVEANAVALTADKVTDVRVQMRSLRDAWAGIDALNASPAFTNLNEAIDDRVAVLIADSVSLTRVYDDAAGVLTFEVDTNYLSEFVDDRLNNTLVVTANTGLSKVYDDAGAVLTLAGVAATAAAMGMMPSADKAKLDAATDANTASAIVRRTAAGDFSAHHVTLSEQLNNTRVTLLTLNNPGGGSGVGSQIDFTAGGQAMARIAQDFDLQPQNIDEGMLRFYLAKSPNFALFEIFRLDYQSPHAAVFGDFNATGAVSAGSKPFVIDHPDPRLAREKMLRYVAVEAPRPDVMIRGRATLAGGRAEVDLDAAARQSGGTLVALARDVQAFVWNESRGARRFERVVCEVEGAVLRIESETEGADGLDVGFVVLGERQDPFMLNSTMTDEDGRWIAEYDKPALAPERVAALLEGRSEVVDTDEDAPDEVQEEEVNDLLGVRGRLLHPEARGEKPPLRRVTRKTRRRRERSRDAGDEGGRAGKK